MDRKYPRFAYHKDLAPEGRLIKSEEHEPADMTGWVTTPAAFDPSYKEPTPDPLQEDIPAEARAHGYVRNPYPRWVYAADGRELLVQTAEQFAELDPKEWKSSPAHHTPEGAAQAKEVAKVEPKLSPAEQKKQVEEFARKAAECHKTPVADILKELEGTTDRAKIERVKNYEMFGEAPRVSLVRALDDLLKKLPAATPAPEVPPFASRSIAHPAPKAAEAPAPKAPAKAATPPPPPPGLPDVGDDGRMKPAEPAGSVQTVASGD